MFIKILLVVLVSYQISTLIGAGKELYEEYTDWIKTEKEIESLN